MTYSTALSAINTPFITGTVGAAAAACLPGLERSCSNGEVAFPVLKVLNLAAYALSFYATSQPGRLDGYQSTTSDNDTKKKKKQADAVVREFMNLRRGGSLLTPSGWAFIIWAPIFLGELIFTITSLVAVQPGTPVALLVQKVSAGFIVAQLYQTLWAAVFRPKYVLDSEKNRILSTCLSAAMLTGIATSLNRAHLAYSQNAVKSIANYVLYFLPISLHFGWTTAAALVNWNGSLAVLQDNPRVVAAAGWISSIGATIIGVYVSVSRSAPVYGGVIAWALAACASGMNLRVEERDRLIQKERAKWIPKTNVIDAIRNRKGMYGSQIQKWLCTAGALISGSVSAFTLVRCLITKNQ